MLLNGIISPLSQEVNIFLTEGMAARNSSPFRRLVIYFAILVILIEEKKYYVLDCNPKFNYNN